ncbi:polymorphic toxin-type HINT domain-containing protein [Actinocorallia sp. A-T 12471]|uniref:polymorphic toxin-type HINT domain-containing protein n=1 Tax=Actinocorallia sp. A-T 12471 TaxID=3089813 RepID=UPI0029CE5CF5|nr:polymorphic toxin-type HINT domain-containing protein [Actinocorallia sp. A-T 12471]MDX6740110.1 polymorphic toxin-type HINT domain-containing protein [Actinocorallia sp. A-T 12471]
MGAVGPFLRFGFAAAFVGRDRDCGLGALAALVGQGRDRRPLKLGDKIRATDEKTGITTPRSVVATIKGTGHKTLVTLTIDTDGPKGHNTAHITATDNHPFWVPSLHRWVKATNLTPGTWLSTGPGTKAQLTTLTRTTTPTTVHNLTTTTDHTYYVLAGWCGAASGPRREGPGCVQDGGWNCDSMAIGLKIGGRTIDIFPTAGDGLKVHLP